MISAQLLGGWIVYNLAAFGKPGTMAGAIPGMFGFIPF